MPAPYVNLIPQKLPGDLYGYVAEHVWRQIDKKVSEIDEKELEDLNKFIDELAERKKELENVSDKDERKSLVKRLIAFKDKALIAKAAPVMWSRITDLKERRKIVKRNVMVLPLIGGSKIS